MLNDPVIASVYPVDSNKEESYFWTIDEDMVNGIIPVHTSVLGLSSKDNYEVSFTITDPNRKTAIKIVQLTNGMILADGTEMEPHRYRLAVDSEVQLQITPGLYKLQCRLLKDKKVVSNGKAFFYCKKIEKPTEPAEKTEEKAEK